MLPEFNREGDLPPGVYNVTLEEITHRFGNGHNQRREVTQRLHHIYRLAQDTEAVRHFPRFRQLCHREGRPKRC